MHTAQTDVLTDVIGEADSSRCSPRGVLAENFSFRKRTVFRVTERRFFFDVEA
jgi:hypothetical protein